MKKAILIIVTAFLMASCAQLKNAKVSGIEDAIDKVTIVCNIARMLADSGLDVPGVDQCEEIVEQLTREEVATIIEILKCSQDFKPSTKEFGKCAVDKGWNLVRDKILTIVE